MTRKEFIKAAVEAVGFLDGDGSMTFHCEVGLCVNVIGDEVTVHTGNKRLDYYDTDENLITRISRILYDRISITRLNMLQLMQKYDSGLSRDIKPTDSDYDSTVIKLMSLKCDRQTEIFRELGLMDIDMEIDRCDDTTLGYVISYACTRGFKVLTEIIDSDEIGDYLIFVDKPVSWDISVYLFKNTEKAYREFFLKHIGFDKMFEKDKAKIINTISKS